ncbi:aminoglycoside phosphotransferase family protein [Arthrobacter sp. SLBN-122]|uniref:aminoglycoside phosphotransferase family protein n=1 Tax=Arthrobacter sp. SLBN-122 TaxID=2768455 RepID=UPI00116E07D8|nr:aminoglycoside phosphotransferase family protein [Arthrobacter sp. SLBN-122]TQJ34023.1 phosphotransferase family enzyme [Arthrobacter sp. SLBN-122]
MSAPNPDTDARALRQAIAEALLTSPPPLDALPPGRAQVLTRSVVHASRSRPVVRWTVALGSGSGTSTLLAVIGKAYLAGGGEQAWRLLRSLREVCFDDGDLRVPAPYGYDPSRQLLAQEEAPSTTLHSLLDGDPRSAAPEAGRAGRWLARLHHVRGVHVPDLAADFERLKLAEYAEALAGLLPQVAARVAELTAATVEELARADGSRVLTHGDFQPKNIHLDRKRLVVIDFDRAAWAPAARDLGHFIGQTLTMGASRHGNLAAAVPWVDTFLENYLAAGGDEGAVRSVPAYVARTFAEVLFYRLVVRPVKDSSFVPDWLDAWEEALSATAGGRSP